METQSTNTVTDNFIPNRNEYVHIMTGRFTSFENLALTAFARYAVIARSILEAFLRANFGERYFSLGLTIIISLILLIIPLPELLMRGGSNGLWRFIQSYLTLYIFIGLYIRQSIKHYRAVQILKRAFHLDKMSTYEGDINDFFWSLKIKGREVTRRQIECFLEPGIFLALGLILFVFGQVLGLIFIFCAVIYSLSRMASYEAANNMMLDIIDMGIATRAMEEIRDNLDRKSQSLGLVIYGGETLQNSVHREEIINGFTNKPQSTEVE